MKDDDKVYVYRKMIHSISLCELKCRFWLVVSDTRSSKTSDESDTRAKGNKKGSEG